MANLSRLLKTIWCCNNIKLIDKLPNTLTFLYCDDNKLTILSSFENCKQLVHINYEDTNITLTTDQLIYLNNNKFSIQSTHFYKRN